MTKRPIAICDQVLDNLTTTVMIFDRALQMIYLNSAGEDLLGISVNTNHKVGAAEVFTDPAYIEVIKNGLMNNQAFIQRQVPLHIAGQEIFTQVDCAATPLYDDGDSQPCYMLVEIYSQPKHRYQTEEYLKSQMNATRAVVRGLAHEIKNPLGGLRGAAQLLEKELPDESLKEFTRIIIGEADRLQNLLNRMMTPNRVPVKKIINIHQVVERVYQLVKVELPDHIRIERDYDPSIPEINVDEDQLIQALLNIVRNATQVLEQQQSGLITLKTRTERQCTIGSHCYKLAVRIDVIDNGPGIPDEIMDQIFFPMVTGRAQGTGLGLSIAQSLINHHGGSLQCSNEQDTTVFTILLPLELENGT